MRLLILLVSLILCLEVYSQEGNRTGENPPPDDKPPKDQRPPKSKPTEQPLPSRNTQPQFRPNDVSPVRGIRREDNNQKRFESAGDTRTFDGTDNNRDMPLMGSAHSELMRIADADYQDGISSLSGANRNSARLISNLVFDQPQNLPNSHRATDFLWQWGQFLDHDIDLTDGADPREDIAIPVPEGDIYFDPDSTGIEAMVINRSLYSSNTGTTASGPRQQINEITAWIDASNVYGSDLERVNALRTLDGSGQLKTSDGNLLPFNEFGLANAGGPSARLFIAGDVRANEQVGLAVMHTLFLREHNRLAVQIAADNPSLSGDEIFQRARQIVSALMQIITYNEFLPIILGSNALMQYRTYNPKLDASIANEFSTAAYRFGHTMLSSQILRLDAQGNAIEQGHLPLRDAFFRPDRVINEGGLEPVLRGLASQISQRIDSYVVDDIRNFLFGNPGEGGFDLAAVNIQRGRDHGLASYNDTRRALGLTPRSSFAQISTDPLVQQKLASAYNSVEDVDLWVGGLAESHHKEAMVGEVFYYILKQQFERLRDADRFWYQRTFSRSELRELEHTKLSDIIRRNTDIDGEINDNVFISSQG